MSFALMTALLEISALRTEVTLPVAIAVETAAAISLLVVVAVAGLLPAGTAGDEGGQAPLMLLLAAARLRIALEIGLRLRRLRPILLLLRRRRHRRTASIRLRIRIARLRLVALALAFAIEIVARVHVWARIGLLLLVRILLRELGLRRGYQSKIMLGVLQIAFGGDRVARGLRVARELDVLLGDVMGGAAYFHFRAIRFVDAG